MIASRGRCIVASSVALLFLSTATAQDPETQSQQPGSPPSTDDTTAADQTQDEDEPDPIDDDLFPIDETVVTATRFERELFDLPRSISIANEEYLRRRNLITALDALNERIGVWVEKRNGVSSDPVIRGFSGANILALVDGDSLTTLWGEGGYAGDDMYGKVDSESIERIEVIRGPSSVIYGSNSLGGVINMITRKPRDYTDGNFEFGGRVKTSFWGSSDGVMLRGDVDGATDNFRFRLGYTTRDIDDTRGGGDLGLLDPSGATDSNFDLNSEFRLAEHHWLEFNAQFVNRNALPKYYRPNQRNNNDRQAGTLRWNCDDIAFGDRMHWGIYYQNKEDERYWLDQPKEGIATWETFATDFQTVSSLGSDHTITWGIHLSRQFGESPDDEQFTITTPATGTQKASPDSTWDNGAGYAQWEWDLGEDWALTSSARFDYFHFEADDNEFYPAPGSTAPENIAQTAPGTHEENAWTGGLGLSKHLDPDWMAFGSWSRGYRLFPPGFGLSQTGYGVLAPTDGFLNPTTADQFELGTRVRRSWWGIGASAYYSLLNNVQQPVPGSYMGQDYIDLDGNGVIDPDERVYVTTGADGYVTGIEIDSVIELGHLIDGADEWSWHNGFMANYGRVDYDTGDEPLRHTHPPRILSILRWQGRDAQRNSWMEFVGDFVGKFDQVSDARLNSDVGYLNDPQDSSSGLITDYGLPGYVVCHIRGGVDVADGVQLTVGIENLFDTEYRTAHSRMDSSGRNVWVGVQATF